ncbi:MAG: tetratricopeptide repeat protein [Bacteroidales bacterium]|jgi:tetratricopeptide (TPR) repeat protein|nr:tetratricopeptide repeat protein [Bacteroidales bacterium]
MQNLRGYIILATVFILTSTAVRGNDLFQKANEAYNQKDYVNAIQQYEALVKEGYEDGMLYYNLGNACYKNNQLAKSLLWYERALRLNPNNEDIKHNIAFVNQQTIDKIEVQPEFFLKTWFSAVRDLFTVQMWAIISIVFVVIGCICIVLLLLLSSPRRRVSLFISACIVFVMAILGITFACLQKSNVNRTDEAIIMQKIITVKSTPDMSGTDLFTVHEGIKILITDKAGNWIEVRFSNGNKGWIKEDAVEII